MIHGPIITLQATATEDEAIEVANLLPAPRGRGSHVLTEDSTRAVSVLRRLQPQFVQVPVPDDGSLPLTKLRDFVTWQPHWDGSRRLVLGGRVSIARFSTH